MSSTKNSLFLVHEQQCSQATHLMWSIGSCVLFYKEAMCKGSTRNGLLYTAKAVPKKDYFTHLTLTIARKGHWVIGPNYRASHPRHFCAVGDVVAWRYDVLRDWLWDACHMAGVRRGSPCKGFCSKEGPYYRLEWSVRKLSQDKRQSTYSQERYESCSVQWTFAAETIGKRWKRDNSPVVRLLPGSHERLALRNPRVLCQKHGGACMTY